MTKFIIIALMCYGLCNIVIYGHGPFHLIAKTHAFLEKLHPQLNEVISCFMCFGFWVGFTFSALDSLILDGVDLMPFSSMLEGECDWYYSAIVDGFLISGTSWLINTVQEMIERTNKEEDE